MPKLKLTDKGLRNLPIPTKGQIDYFDTLLPAFGVRISYGGSATFFVTARIQGGDGKLVRFSLGRWSKDKKPEDTSDPGLTLGEARDKARLLMDAAKRGIDPRKLRNDEIEENRRKAALTFSAVADEFLSRYADKRLRPASIRAYRTALKTSASEWSDRPISSITKQDALKLIDGIESRGREVLADRTHAYLRKFFNWAVTRDYVEASPFATIRRENHTTSRDRTLSDLEVTWFLDAVAETEWPFGPFMKMLLLTGQRRAEVAGMRWSELTLSGNDPGWMIPRDRAKNNREHWVPLVDSALDLLTSLPRVRSKDGNPEFVFTTTGNTPISGFSKAKALIDKKMLELARKDASDPDRIKIAPWTLHDLRRTVASGMARLGQPVHVVEAVLNHKSGTISGVAAVYNRHDYAAEKRSALAAWGAYVASLP